jgi:hypothetical protein
MSVSVLLPTAEPGVPITPYDLRIDPRRFVGTVGFLANSQIGSIDFLASLAPHVAALVPGVQPFFDDRGETLQRSSFPMDDKELEEIAGRCDAAILAYGHCGSCTSATIRDAVALARLGLPVVATVVPRFEAEASQVARAAGVPEVPIFVLPGSMNSRSAGERAEVARAVAPAIVARLTGVQ